MSRKGLVVTVQNATRSPTPSAAEIRRWAAAAFGRSARGELTVRLVDEDESAALNERFRGRGKPTNVLAFPAEVEGGDAAEELLPVGDLVICAPVVACEADGQGKTFEAHWAHIVIHGSLHLIGYDHENEAEAREMESRERELLGGFGFEDPYLLEGQ